MSAVEIFLWPVVGFLLVAALAGLWQARNPVEDSAARRKLNARNWELDRLRTTPLWQRYQEQQLDPDRIARSARRRSLILAGLAAAILVFLLTRS